MMSNHHVNEKYPFPSSAASLNILYENRALSLAVMSDDVIMSHKRSFASWGVSKNNIILMPSIVKKDPYVMSQLTTTYVFFRMVC